METLKDRQFRHTLSKKRFRIGRKEDNTIGCSGNKEFSLRSKGDRGS